MTKTKLTYHVSNSDNEPVFAQAKAAATNRNRRNKPTVVKMPWDEKEQENDSNNDQTSD